MPVLHEDSPLDIPSEWSDAALRIRRESFQTVMVLGATDVGKSAFSHFLVRRLRSSGCDTALLDADVGQAELGPPASIALERAGQSGTFEAVESFFVGSTNPADGILPMVAGTTRLAWQARRDRVVINTSGLIRGPGHRLKSCKIDAVAPDGIVAIRRHDELRPLLHAYRHIPQIELPPSPAVRRKTAAERRGNRRRAFQRYFRDARDLEFDVDAIAFQRTGIFSGTPVPAGSAVYAERLADGTTIFVGEPERLPEKAKVLPEGFERSLLCGVADMNQRGVGVAVVQAIDFSARRILLRTAVPAAAVAVLQLGSIRLDFDWHRGGDTP